MTVGLFGGWRRRLHRHRFKAVGWRNYCYCKCGEALSCEDSRCYELFVHGPKINWSEVPGETRN